MIKILISIFAVFLIFKGCAGVSDVVEELPNGYTYVDEALRYKYIIFEQANSVVEQEMNTLPCTIIEYKYDKKYIIAKIKFHYDVNYGTIGFNESKILKEGKIYYYIIDTEKNIRYGAFEDKKKYLIKKKELNINPNLNPKCNF